MSKTGLKTKRIQQEIFKKYMYHQLRKKLNTILFSVLLQWNKCFLINLFQLTSTPVICRIILLNRLFKCRFRTATVLVRFAGFVTTELEMYAGLFNPVYQIWKSRHCINNNCILYKNTYPAVHHIYCKFSNILVYFVGDKLSRNVVVASDAIWEATHVSSLSFVS